MNGLKQQTKRKIHIVAILLLIVSFAGCPLIDSCDVTTQCENQRFDFLSGNEFTTTEPYNFGDGSLTYSFRFYEDCVASFEFEVENKDPANYYHYIMMGYLKSISSDDFTSGDPGKFTVEFMDIFYETDEGEIKLRSWEYGWSLPHSSNSRLPASGEYMRGVCYKEETNNCWRFYLPDPPAEAPENYCLDPEADPICPDPKDIPENEFWINLCFEPTKINTPS